MHTLLRVVDQASRNEVSISTSGRLGSGLYSAVSAFGLVRLKLNRLPEHRHTHVELQYKTCTVLKYHGVRGDNVLLVKRT